MTNMLPTEESILKTDSKGRVQTPVARRESLLDEFERSGLSGKKFAALTGLKYQTFASWLQKRRRARGLTAAPPANAPEPVRWLEAMVAPGQPKGVVVLHLHGGVRLELSDRSQIELAAALVRALAQPVAAC